MMWHRSAFASLLGYGSFDLSFFPCALATQRRIYTLTYNTRILTFFLFRCDISDLVSVSESVSHLPNILIKKRRLTSVVSYFSVVISYKYSYIPSSEHKQWLRVSDRIFHISPIHLTHLSECRCETDTWVEEKYKLYNMAATRKLVFPGFFIFYYFRKTLYRKKG